MTKKLKRQMRRIIIGAVVFVLGVLCELLPLPETPGFIAQLVCFVAAYFIIGGDVLLRAVKNITHGKVFDENFLMCLATIGAFCLQEFTEAVAVMLFYQVGEWFQSYAVGKSRKSIAGLMDIRPDHANIEQDGQIKEVSPESVKVDDIIVIKAGERVPLDGVILEGNSHLDTAALTGESLPREVAPGDEIISGCINGSGLLRVRVTKVYGESTVARILDLVENASSKKAKTENFITKFARYYTPIVVVVAVLLAIVPPLLFHAEWHEWIERALILLMVSCPCALVISVPLSFFGGIGGASRNGVLIKGSNYLEALAKTKTVVFDKTGTLTNGTFSVTALHPEEMGEKQLLEMAALAEYYSDHPIGLSVKTAYGAVIDTERLGEITEKAGHGVLAHVDGRHVLAGNDKWMRENNIPYHECEIPGTIVHVAVDGKYEGHIVISDTVKPDAKQAIADLKKAGVTKTVMLTGDRKAVGEYTAKELGLDAVYAELLPQDKVSKVEELLDSKPAGTNLAFVGDGINDAPVLTRADVGIAMGAMGSDAAIEAADIVLMDDKPSKIAQAISISRRTLRIVRQNIWFALGVKAIVLVATVFGLSNMWEGIIADVGVSVIAILNAIRALKK